MLDSLVRVSRRVGQVTDRFASNAETTKGHPPRATPRLSGTENSPRRSNDATRTGPGAVREGLPLSTGGPTQSESITPTPKRWLPSPNASDRRSIGSSAQLRRKCAHRHAARPRNDRPVRRVATQPPHDRRAESDELTLRSSPFASKRFHVLLNSLFKVLFNFPSRYLFAIGLVSVFSLRWSLPPTLGCNLKQPDSWDDSRDPVGGRRGLTPALGEAPIRRTRTAPARPHELS
jgi:hypothetical protein